MEQQTERLINMVTEMHKRFDKLNINYVSIGQCMGKNVYICASLESLELIKKYLLPDEMEISIFSKSTS